MGRTWDKFVLLSWKNWKLQYRKPLQTCVEIIAPILFSILLVILRSLVEPVKHPPRIFLPFVPVPSMYYPPLGESTKNYSVVSPNFLKNFTIVYSPSQNEALDTCMKLLKPIFREVKSFKDESALEKHFVNDGNTTFVAIKFDDNLQGQDYIPKNVEISIRFPAELRTVGFNYSGESSESSETSKSSNDSLKKNSSESAIDKLDKLFKLRDWRTNLLYPLFQTPGPREPKSNVGALPNYFLEGFLGVQYLLTHLLLFGQVNISTAFLLPKKLPLILMQRFPHATWYEDPLLQPLISFTGMLVMLSFVYTCISTVRVITTEKEKQLKEAMMIMGLSNWIHWTAWFIKTFIFLLISISFIVLLLTIAWYPDTNFSLFTFLNPFVLFIFFLFYICAIITFCFSVSVFFSKANTAATVAGLLWFLSYAPYMFLQPQYDQLNLSIKLSACLGFNTAMAYGMQVFLMYEGSGEGVTWSNIWKPVTPDDNLTLGLVMIMLFVDTIIYLIITVYVEAVFPGEFGTPHPWYFPFTCTYWCGTSKRLNVEEFDSIEISTPPDLHPGIQIRNLRKVFKKKVAVHGLSLDMYEDQITVLLGHNGAGKTTTMSMLTGVIPPTSGFAVIQGYNIRTNMKEVRANLGLCPQHNILFDDLTVREHLYFFSKLKGLRKNAVEDEINKFIALLKLESKADKKTSTLSGGMQRKLCVGMALCGNSKVVMLDEPTAAMDPSSRRDLWDLLQEQKRGRCILLTTHYMDEADLLGDRIAIMAKGELKCCDTSFGLKKKYGFGYHLILDMLPDCQPELVTEVLQKYIPDIKIHRYVGSEVTYVLKEDHINLFEALLTDLERNSKRLLIRSYGISLTTMEDVFIKVGADDTNTAVDMDILKRTLSRNKSAVLSMQALKPRLLTGCKLLKNQFLAMLTKKALSIVRTWLLQIIQIIIPVTYIIISILVSRNMNQNRMDDLPKLKLTPDVYPDPIILVQDEAHSNFSKLYYETLEEYDTKVETVKDITNTMLNLTDSIPATVKKRYLAGATFALLNKTTLVTAWFNNDPYHTPAIALALVLNVAYKTVLGRDHSITFYNHPLPYTTNSKIDKLLSGNTIGFQLAFNIGFSMAFISSFYILFYIRERVCKSKHLQFASGVKSYIFWTTAFLCDLATFIVTISALIITIVCFQEDGFKTAEDIGRMFFIMFYFGIAMLPLMYLCSYLFEIPSTGYTRMTLFGVFTGVTAFLVVHILETPQLELEYVADGLHWAFLIFPHYSLATSIRDSYTTYATDKMCKFYVDSCMEQTNMTIDQCWDMACHNEFSESLADYCCVREPDYYQWESPGIGRNMLYSLLTGFILFFILILTEHKIATKLLHFSCCKGETREAEKVPNEDDDVLKEKERIRKTSETQLMKEDILLLKDATKYYNKFLAVNGICLGVKEYECFGLLGVNGAGKTTTFKMITGDIPITSGDVWICGFSVKTDLEEIQKSIGYCPQFDALLIDLTAKETLVIFCLLRGVPMGECHRVCERLAKDFDFSQHLHKRVKELSGGNKRKLSTALALIGDPPVICLDEPTAGMDPVTKRNLWDALCSLRESGKCVLLTSHSMEECEALCTRLAIMVNGNFQCLGSVQHLKNKFAAGYTLTIKIKRQASARKSEQVLEEINKFVGYHFPKAVQQEHHQELVSYYIVDKNITWSKMFGVLEKEKHRLNIEDYFLGQASLEQVFLRLTKYQH